MNAFTKKYLELKAEADHCEMISAAQMHSDDDCYDMFVDAEMIVADYAYDHEDDIEWSVVKHMTGENNA